MSKYNLIDIYEQYQIGSGWTKDFDYDGMLKTGLGTSIDTPIEVLKKISDDFEDVNYHRENSHLQDVIDAIEIGDMMQAQGKISDFHAEIRKTQEDQGMDVSDDLGAYMASKMEEGKKEEVEEVRIDRDVAERIEGMLSIPLKKKFLDAFMDLWQDLIEEDPFYAEDVINHLNNEMHREIDGYQAMGDKLAGIGESSDEYVDEIGEGAMQSGEADLEAGVKGNMDAFNEGDDCSKHDYKQIDTDGTAECTKCGLRNSDPSKTGEKVRSEGYAETKGAALYPILKAGANATGDEVEMYVKSLAKDIELNGKEQYKDFTSDDYVEDFKNYIADKSLQEHFSRFLKDYQ